jgi:hypothetical protein
LFTTEWVGRFANNPIATDDFDVFVDAVKEHNQALCDQDIKGGGSTLPENAGFSSELTVNIRRQLLELRAFARRATLC